jgi:hypothetical protein
MGRLEHNNKRGPSRHGRTSLRPTGTGRTAAMSQWQFPFQYRSKAASVPPISVLTNQMQDAHGFSSGY